MKAIVHVGMHKAGSSTIQTLLKKNREHLTSAGVYVCSRHGHEKLRTQMAKKLNTKRKNKQALAGYINELANLGNRSDYSNAVLSDEGLEFLLRSEDDFSGMHAQLSQYFSEITYLVIVRDVIDYAASAIQQGIKALNTYDTKMVTATRVKERLNKHPFNYLARFSALLNPEITSRFLPFQEMISVPGSQFLAGLFRSEFGLDISTIKEAPLRNQSIGAKGVAAASFFRFATLQSIGLETIPQDLRQKLKKRIVKLAAQYKWCDVPFRPYDTAAADEILTTLAEANNEFAQRVWGRSYEEIFPRKEIRLSTCNLAELNSDELQEVSDAYDIYADALAGYCSEMNYSYKKQAFSELLPEYLEMRRKLLLKDQRIDLGLTIKQTVF